jgi:chromate reductase
MKKILAISGSLRKDSYNTAILKHLQTIAPQDVEVRVVTLENIPLFNAELEANMPSAVLSFKADIEGADGIIIATPEYNRSIPGVLKNAIDWATRPRGSNSFKGKYTMILGASNGQLGTAVAQSHLKEILVYLDTKFMGQPEVYINNVDTKMSQDGILTDEPTKAHLQKVLEQFVARIA